MGRTHGMTIEADNGDELLLVCPEDGCGRRLVLRRSGGLVVLDRGDPVAVHVAGGLALGVSAASHGAGDEAA